MALPRLVNKTISRLALSVETIQKDLKTSSELAKLENLNVVHGLKSVTEGIRQLSKKIEARPEANPQTIMRRRDSAVDELKAEIESLKRQQQLRENRPIRSPKIGSIREFCPKSESDNISCASVKKPGVKAHNGVKPVHVREFRLDSSLSQVVRPLDLLKDSQVIEQWGSDSSCIKTPTKKAPMVVLPDRKFKHFLEDDEGTPDNARTPAKNTVAANVKDFDDFKFLLKDLKMSLNMSDFSTFHDNLNEQMGDLEKILTDYADLDKRIASLANGKVSDPKMVNSSFDAGLGVWLDLKKSQSFMAKPDSGNKYLKELEALKQTSNIQEYSMKLKDLKCNPSDFETFVFKVRRELGSRKRKFEEINEFLV